jgi:hypothetical protein
MLQLRLEGILTVKNMYCLIDGDVLSKQICIEHEEKYAFGNSNNHVGNP